MIDYVAQRDKERPPTHPGFLLENTVLPAVGRSKTEIASLLGMSRQSLHGILAGKQPVTPETAVKLGALFGNGPRLWINMQANYDLWQAQRKVDVSRIRKLEPA